MRGSIHLGTYFGIPVYLHWSFFLLIAYIVYDSYRRGMDQVNILWFVLLTLTIFMCVTLHEFGHALTAKKYQITTKDIILSPIGGVARLKNMPKFWHQEFLIALAGPAVNVVISILLGLYLYISGTGIPEQMESIAGSIRNNFLFLVLVTNVFLVIFNMIPAFPMDGGRVFRALLSIPFGRLKATLVAARIGQALAILFMAYSMYQAQPIHLVIGIFIFFAASAELRSVQYDSWLETLVAADMGEPAPGIFSEEELHFHPHRQEYQFWVVENGALEPQYLIEKVNASEIQRPFHLVDANMDSKAVIRLKRSAPNDLLLAQTSSTKLYTVISNESINDLFVQYGEKRRKSNLLHRLLNKRSR
ncbi:MAG TPA: site-2 protease family protein [Saprospiraceae bacterium]|nr:site-2 protease family protein [Saprospiraceae bacterium]